MNKGCYENAGVELQENIQNCPPSSISDQHQGNMENIGKRPKNTKKVVGIVLAFLCYNVYLSFALYFHFEQNRIWDSCHGIGFVVVVTSLVYLGIFYFTVLKPFFGKKFRRVLILPVQRVASGCLKYSSVRIGLYMSTVTVIGGFLIFDCWTEKRRLISAGGIVILVALGAITSKYPKRINWRQVTWGLVLQFIFGLLILRWKPGKELFECLGSKVDRFLKFTDVGSGFVFGYLVNQKPFIPSRLNESSLAYNVTMDINDHFVMKSVVVFKALSVIYFFSFFISMLFYLGTMQWIAEKLGWLLQVTVGTTPCESLTAASNIFIGQAMAPLLIKPYLNDLTLSEIHAVMTGGFATIAGTVLAIYINFGVSASHLLSASVMSAPAALAYSKLFYPETEVSKITMDTLKLTKSGESSILDAATRGAATAATLVLHITAIVIAFIAFIAFLNAVVEFFASLVGFEGISFEWFLGKIFIPLAWIMGVDWAECEKVGKLIGIKSVINEFIAYRRLGLMIEARELSPRSMSITTYALCGYANPGSIGVQLAALGAIAPERKSDFAKVVVRSFIAGSAACFLTACIAGSLITDQGVEAST